MQPTICSGVISAMSFQTGLRSTFAQRSQAALTIAAVARWMAPFSGPIQRSWLSPVTFRQKPAISPAIDSNVSPATSGASAFTAATQTSLPRPIVNVIPWPSMPSAPSVSSTTYAAE